jgi:hypothetical protein
MLTMVPYVFMAWFLIKHRDNCTLLWDLHTLGILRSADLIYIAAEAWNYALCIRFLHALETTARGQRQLQINYCLSVWEPRAQENRYTAFIYRRRYTTLAILHNTSLSPLPPSFMKNSDIRGVEKWSVWGITSWIIQVIQYCSYFILLSNVEGLELGGG